MKIIKGKGQRLIPEELLKYLEAYKENHPDPTAGGGVTLDDIVDSQGNKRFIEGDGVNGSYANVSYLYNKWSLSGTHLMLVTVFKVNSSQDFSANTTISTFKLPQFIIDKITNISTNIVLRRNCDVYVNEAITANIETKLIKNNDELKINVATYSLINSGDARIQVDLVIDANYE